MPIATNGTHIESPIKNQSYHQADNEGDDRRELDRPADVVEDMRQMGQRQRVKTILNSREFRDELEAIITDALKHGPHPASLVALQQISELLLPHTSRWTTVSSLSRAGGSVIVPVNDIRGVDSQGYSKSERLLRCKLASLYRLVDLFGWSQGIYNHITARVNQEQEHFLINPFGLMYHEVTGSSLVKVDIAGNVIDSGSTTYGINRAGYTLHSAIHKARPDLKCVIHLHTPAVAAVSAMKCGLLPLSQDALFCGKISYHDYRGILIEDDVKKLLVEDLGPINKVMILRNHGFVACGETIEEAWKYAYNVINACEVQVRAAPLGIDQLYLPSNEQQKRIADVLQGNVNEATGDKKWKIGELEFESLMRILDNAGFRTGYVYRQPLIRTIDKTTTFKDVEVPPAASSATSFVEQLLPEAYSPTRQAQRTTEWRNSPDAYLRQEVEETGTPNPKKVTKWVPDTGLKHSTPIKIDTKHQFAPSNVDPKLLKTHQKQMKEDRFNEKVSAGYQSKILENAAWDDVSQMKEPHQPSSEAVVVVGAASKGIIKRDQQNNAIVYKTYYAQNPFAHMDNHDIEKYKREVEQNQMREQAFKKNALLDEIRKGGDSHYDDQIDSQVEMQRQQISRTSSSDESNDSLLSRVLIHSAEQISEHTLPLSITPSLSPAITTRRTTHTQTLQDTQASFPSKSIPSFAETQLLSVYYPSQNPKNPSTNDKCIFVEQQDRQPVRYRTAYDPSSSVKTTQTSPPSPPLSTYGSTLIIDQNQQIRSNYEHHLKIHSGSQNLSSNIQDQHALPNELIEESRYSYEEYIVQLDKKPSRLSSSSSSSVTTVIAQNEELDSDHTSRLSFDPINTQSSTSSTSPNREIPVVINNQRVSSWPPVPDDILTAENHEETDEQKRLSRVQFAEQLIRVIPPSTKNSQSDDSLTPPAVAPRTTGVDPRLVREELQRLDHIPKNQSKWIKTHMDNSEIKTNTTSNRVDTLRSMFEQQTSRSSDSSTITSPTNQRRRIEPEEKSSKHGDEIRFRVQERKSSSIHHAEPARITQQSTTPSVTTKQQEQSTSPFKLDQINQITGKQFKSLDAVGHYLQDGRTWQWNEIFWLSLTTSQRDQLRDLEHQIYSRSNSVDHSFHQNDSDVSSLSSSIETKRFKSTINVTGAGAWQQHRPQTASSGITRYTEINTIHENQPSVAVFSSTPNDSYVRVGSQESIASSNTQQQFLNSSKRTDSQITIIESGYGSADDQQRFRPNSSTIIEESPIHPIDSNKNPPFQPKLDPLSYQQFIYDYLSTHARYRRANDNTILLSIHGQDIHLSSSAAENTSIPNSIYLNAIDERFSPFETESGELVVFLYEEIILIPADQWSVYREKYRQSPWIRQLKRVNRCIPQHLIPIIEQWLADHATFDTHEVHVDGLTIPLIERLHLHQSQSWNELLKYLIRIGYVSYNSEQKLIHIAHSELDAQRLLKSPSPERLERLSHFLQSLNSIHFDQENDTLMITDDFTIPNHYINHQQEEELNLNELAHLLLQICEIDEDEQSIILTFQNQTLQLTNTSEDHVKILSQWLQQLNQQKLITITDENDIIIYPNHPNQQIFIHHQHVNTYIKKETIDMTDIAHILLLYNYVQYVSGQFRYGKQQLVLDTNEQLWLQSIIRSIRTREQTHDTEIELFDGQHTQLLHIPYEYLSPTDNAQIVATYLLQNGSIRYEVNRGNYAYHYNSPEEVKPPAIVQDTRSSQTQSVHTEQTDHLVNHYVEFINNHDGVNYDNTNDILILENPSDGSKLLLTQEHTQFIRKNQYRRQDMKQLLLKYSHLKEDEFGNWLLYYNNQCIQIPSEDQENIPVSPDLSQETPNEFLDRYHATIDYMANHGLITCNKRLRFIRIHFSNQILTIPIDQLRSIVNIKIFHSPNDDLLPFDSRELSQWLLTNASQINNSPHGFIQLTYKNKIYDLPVIRSNHQHFEKHEQIDSNLQLLFPFDTSQRFIQKTSSITTLDIEQPNATNNYSIDPLLMLANHIHRAGTIYQDNVGRLVIKLNHDEIVIPRLDATSSIEAINTSPNRSGTIIARLINRIGRVQSNQAGGLIITIGKSSFELSKETIDRANHLSIENDRTSINRPSKISSNLPLLQHSRSTSSLLSSTIEHPEFTDDQQMLYTKDSRHVKTNRTSIQTALATKPRIIIIPDNSTSGTTRFYLQRQPNSNPSSMPVQSQLINPQQYRDVALRQALVCVRRPGGDEEVYYENLAEYLSTKQDELSSRTVRRMLNFTSRNEYFAYLNKNMSAKNAEQLVQQSEESSHHINIKTKRPEEEMPKSPIVYYNVQNGTTINESNLYHERQDTRYHSSSRLTNRSASSSSLNSDMLIANTFPSSRTVLGNTHN